MDIPKLQFACDHGSLKEALKDAGKVGDVVDILEAGTILLLQEGRRAIEELRALYPQKLLVADPKCADAGAVIARNCSSAGADYMTVICAASVSTMKAAAKEVKEVQIELFGNWTMEQAKSWLHNGISQVIYHQSRDIPADQAWGEKDLEPIRKLAAMGFRVSVTGGLTRERLELFRGIPVYAFIVGRAISEKADPHQAALDFQAEIRRIWA